MKFLISILLALAISGCSLVDRIGRDDTTARLVVQYATISLIDRSGNITGDDVLDHVGRVKAVIDQDSGTTVARLVAEAETHIPWEKINRADQLLVRALLVAVSDELESRVGDGTLDPDQRFTVRTLLGWIEAAAMM